MRFPFLFFHTQILHSLRTCKRVIILHEAFQTSADTFLITELCTGTLSDVLRIYPEMSIPGKVYYVAEMVAAIGELHERGVIHRDLKPANIFISNAGRVKLGDFGEATFVDENGEAKFRKGSIGYSAPEVFNFVSKPYSYSADWYSLGAIVYEIFSKMEPFITIDLSQVLDDDAKDFVTRLMAVEPEQRMKFEEVKSHPLMKFIDWDKMDSKEWEAPFENFCGLSNVDGDNYTDFSTGSESMSEDERDSPDEEGGADRPDDAIPDVDPDIRDADTIEEDARMQAKIDAWLVDQRHVGGVVVFNKLISCHIDNCMKHYPVLEDRKFNNFTKHFDFHHKKQQKDDGEPEAKKAKIY